MKDWEKRQLTVLGLSRSGMAVAEYVSRHGGDVFLSEVLPATPTNEANRKKLESLGVPFETGGHSKRVYTHAPQVVVSPGIPPSSAILTQLAHSGLEIVSEVELAYRENQAHSQVPMIGVTGTNGKTTTTTLISKILETAGKRAPACGNIGTPLMSVLEPAPDALVVELSSFQLHFSPTLTADIAVFLNLRPDHLDWHGSLEAYQRAKLRLFTGAQSPKWVVVNAEDPLSSVIAENTTARLLWFGRSADAVAGKSDAVYLDENNRIVMRRDGKERELLDATALPLPGIHNRDNVMAAAAAAHLMGVEDAVIQKACLGFTGVEHRLERVSEFDTDGHRVVFYNDSKATNTDAAISALKAFGQEPVILIAGGRDKHELLEGFVRHVRDHARAVVLMGEARERFASALRQVGYSEIHEAADLPGAVKKAAEISRGAPVLFSPACSSFDMYKDFVERGRAFKDAVRALEQEASLTGGSR